MPIRRCRSTYCCVTVRSLACTRVVSHDGERLRVAVPTPFHKDWLELKLAGRIRAALQRLGYASWQVEYVVDYTPRYDAKGELIGYEEPLPEGVQIRGLDGRRLGVRYRDLRGRGMNPAGEGVSVSVPQPPK